MSFQQETWVADFSGAAYGTISLPAFASNVKPGSTLLIASTANATEVPVLSDTLGNTFSAIDSLEDVPNGQNLSTFYAYNIAGGADQVSGNFVSNSAFNLGIYAAEYAGVTRTNPLRDHNIVERLAVNVGGSISSNTLTPGVTPSLVWGVAMNQTDYSQASPPNAGTGFNTRAAFFLATGNNLARAIDQVVGTKSAIAASFVATGSIAQDYIVAAVVLDMIFWHTKGIQR